MVRIDQLYTSCLSQGAYYIISNGEVAIIDPLREIDIYIKKASEDNAVIKYIFETHFHADFVSGHLSLAEKTQAPIIYGPLATPTFESTIATDNQIFKLGDCTIKVIHTPGHTMESSCFLLIDDNGKEHALFTGDTLFLGDVGRPDLAQKSTSLSQEELAGFLYDSIHTKLLKLPDALTIYPGHGAGSACGKNLSKETIGNLGEQKKTNYALQSSLTKEDFIREVTDGLTPPPAYFPQNVALNQHGYEDIQNVLDNSLVYLTSHEFEEKMQSKDVVILDTRSEIEFINGHIPNSIFIGISGSFAPWVGAILKNVHQKLLVITNKGKEKEVLIRLARVGFDNVLGFLGEGMENWSKEGKNISKIKSIQPIEFSIINSLSTILDVRKTSEFQQGHLAIENLINIPLDQLSENLENLDKNKAFAIHCAGGYRSVIAASILLNNGFTNITNIEGGINAIQKEGYSIVSTITQA